MNLEDMQFVASRRTIVSIYPEPITAELDLGSTPAGGKTIFRIDGAPKGEYRSLVVTDMWESVLDYAQIQFVGQNLRTPRPESAEKIARELVRQWTTGAGSGPGHQPGIMMIAAKEPTGPELDYLNRTQHSCFEWLVLEARGYWHNKKPVNINEKHRIAGKWLNLHEEWIAEVGMSMDKGQCAFCYSPLLDVRATVCAVCGKDQPERKAETIHRGKVAPPVIDEPFKTMAVPVTPPLQPAMAR